MDEGRESAGVELKNRSGGNLRFEAGLPIVGHISAPKIDRRNTRSPLGLKLVNPESVVKPVLGDPQHTPPYKYARLIVLSYVCDIAFCVSAQNKLFCRFEEGRGGRTPACMKHTQANTQRDGGTQTE